MKRDKKFPHMNVSICGEESLRNVFGEKFSVKIYGENSEN
jgi:hypothetical protein